VEIIPKGRTGDGAEAEGGMYAVNERPNLPGRHPWGWVRRPVESDAMNGRGGHYSPDKIKLRK